MLPVDFAAGEPRQFDLARDWGALRRRYGGLGPSPTLNWVYEHVSNLGATVALLEHEYIDGDYRDEYAHFYIQVFRSLPDRCERLHFWAGRRYLGYCSIRPINGQPVCRTMLDPGKGLEDAVSCVVLAKAHPYGRTLTVPAFPFISQDRQYGRCAHAVLWMVAHYHHLANATPACTMSDIVNAAAESEIERTVPSRGLTEEQIGRTLKRIGLPAVRYPVRSGGEESELLLPEAEVSALVRRYLNSRIPLVLATPGHLTAIIGATEKDGVLEVIRCDDEQGAYCPQAIDMDPNSKERWLFLFVPLPGRIYLVGEEILSPGRNTLAALTQRAELQEHSLHERKLRYREYVIDSRIYKTALQTRGLPQRTVQGHLQVSCPRWIWIVEMQDEELAEAGAPCTLGEVAIDATSAKGDPQFLFANVPGLRATWGPQQFGPHVIAEEHPFAPYDSGTALNL